MPKKKKKKKASHVVRARAEIRKIIKAYDKAHYGEKKAVLDEYGIAYSTIGSYRARLANEKA